ncbi:MBL fold metallo-hydrolase [Natronolimnohabitans sp. A-GB9]|uniref:MBL fold metallo-hydrolase n=1 Tax=Natronolimnohabitans sp. A-GB9 TaxID=3069757 RepID=UPI0027AFBB7E|nr:MBL fold metallo-hydrolase [Natronolimnohabitans sp. A-GB9]MDQ2051686.1 MBL fold metallo-hydrolase [Natronolimnohabitans sp. A-GB9]
MSQQSRPNQPEEEGSRSSDDSAPVDQPLVVTPLGGAREVGRSCYHVQTPELDILVDCGLNQGSGGQFPKLREIDEGQIDAVFLTHAHIDHSGGLPVLEHRNLLASDAPLITTRPTTALCHTLLHDSINIHEEETRQQGREQQFTRDDVHDVLERFKPHRYGTHALSRDLRRIDTPADIEYELGGAGHLLGSAWLAIEYGGRRVVFSGDLGGRSAHLPDWETPPPADTLFLESTYGDRQQHRSLKSARNQLYQETLDAVKNGIPVLIPTFAVGRAQEVMQIFRERFPQEPDDVQEKLEVVYDGMARDATAAYHAYSIGEFVNETINNWRMNAQDNEPFLPDCAWYPEDNSERAPILDGDNAPIIVAPSGMLTGGTSPLYLTALAENYDEARVFLIGHQADGTPGRVLQDASGTHIEVSLPVTPFTELDLEADDSGNTTVTIPTSWIQTISGFSGHCARQVLSEFAQDVDAKHVSLVHGPSAAQKECRNYLDKRLNADVVSRATMGTPIPVYGASSGELTNVDLSDGAATAVTVRPRSEVDTSHITDELVNDDESSNEFETEDLETEPEVERSTEERIDALEEKIKQLESELAAARHEGRWTEGELRRLIRSELDSEDSKSTITESVIEAPPEEHTLDSLLEIDGVGTNIIENLNEKGYQTIADIESASESDLTNVDRIGKKIATRMLEQTRTGS